MKRHLTALFATLAAATAATAQLPPPAVPLAPPALNPGIGGQFFQVGPPPPLPSLNVVVPGPTPGPGGPIRLGSAGFYKSGGVIVGANGAYPYDTGVYLLGGMDGLARSTGTFVMVPAGPPGDPWLGAGGTAVYGSGAGGGGGRCGACGYYGR